MQIPERIGRYRLEGLLGQGAMGIVYRAFDPHLQRTVALKTIQPALLADAGTRAMARARFRNEARAAGRIAHPGVVTVFELHEDSEHAADAYLAMEFVAGPNLAQVMAAEPRPDAARVLDIVAQLLHALEAAHGHGVWHRDVKPSNLLLTADSVVKLTYFGVARIAQHDRMSPEMPAGTPGAMAPELSRGDRADHRADIFSCGVLLRRLAAGEARTLPGLDAVVARATAPQPGQRYASARAMRLALAALAPPTRESGDGRHGAADRPDAPPVAPGDTTLPWHHPAPTQPD